MNQALHLSQLQKIDTQLDQINLRLKEITSIMAADQSIQEAEADLENTRQALRLAHRELQKAEEKVQNQRVKIETSDAALYGGKIRNPKELQDIQLEIQSLKKYLVTLEDQQLEAMLVYEAAELEKEQAEQNLIRVQAQQASSQSHLLGEKDTLERQAERLRVEYRVAESQVDANSLSIYRRLREQKRGLAVTAIEDGACKACGSGLRPAELQSARSPNNLVFCSSCGRIIYAG